MDGFPVINQRRQHMSLVTNPLNRILKKKRKKKKRPKSFLFFFFFFRVFVWIESSPLFLLGGLSFTSTQRVWHTFTEFYRVFSRFCLVSLSLRD